MSKKQNKAGDGERPQGIKTDPTASAPAEIITQLRAIEAQRQIALRQQVRMVNSTLSMIRVAMGWKWDEDEDGRAKVKARAQAILAAAWKGKELPEEHDQQVMADLCGMLLALKVANDTFDGIVGTLEKTARKLAGKLPVAAWIKQQPGFSMDTLARLVGSIGDLSGYASWKLCCKRMGLAPYRGKLASSWRTSKGDKLTAEEWVAFGYAPHRRSIMHMVGEAQIRNRTPYRDIYDERKAHELAREDENKPASLMHAHRRAMVLMERRMIRDLWCAWKYGTHLVPEAANELAMAV